MTRQGVWRPSESSTLGITPCQACWHHGTLAARRPICASGPLPGNGSDHPLKVTADPWVTEVAEAWEEQGLRPRGDTCDVRTCPLPVQVTFRE